MIKGIHALCSIYLAEISFTNFSMIILPLQDKIEFANRTNSYLKFNSLIGRPKLFVGNQRYHLIEMVNTCLN